jgi:hypothetical protein
MDRQPLHDPPDLDDEAEQGSDLDDEAEQGSDLDAGAEQRSNLDEDLEIDECLKIGEPFAMANDCEILQGQIVIRCGECQQVFRFNPTDGAIKTCPQCSARYSHVFLVSRDDDDQIFPEAIDHVLYVNRPEESDGDR